MSATPRQLDEAVPALELRELDVAYRVRGIDRRVLRGLSLAVGRGESYGLVGESGCGKTTAAFAAMRYLPRNGRITSGSVLLDGEDLSRMSDDQVRERRANVVSMVYQNPGSALNPSIRVGRQVAEVFRIGGASNDEARDGALEMLRTVQIADPDRVMQRYPHELSGGMQQRVVIAMALASRPELLILDEPTTGLDATVEAEVLDLIAGLRVRFGTSVLFISHNLAVIASMCDRVGVLYAGRLVEEGPARVVFDDPRHPYTVGLLRCIPRGGVRKDRARLSTIPGFLPPLGADITGCVFADRCALADERCRREEPALIPLGAGHASRCHYHDRAQSLPVTSAPPEHVRGRRRGRGPDASGPFPHRVVEDVPPEGTPGQRPVRRVDRRAPGGDARPGRRVREREDDARPDPAGADRSRCRIAGRARRQPRSRRASAGATPVRYAPSRSCSRTPTPR